MADRKITDLTALAAGSQATGDLLTIVDVSEGAAADKNKKITVESLFKGIPSDVGIGTASPSNNLDIAVGANSEGINIGGSGNFFGLIEFDANRSGADQVIGDIAFKWNGTRVARIIGATGADTTNKDDGAITFHTASAGSATEKVRIDSSGRVLIGTTTQGHSTADLFTIASSSSNGMTIRSGSSSSGQISFSDATTGDAEYRGQILYDHGGDFMRFRTAADERLRIDSSGQLILLGNGGSTTNSLDLNYNGTSGQAQINADSGGGNTFLTFGTSSSGSLSERLRIDSSGNVGIGESSPSTLLSLGTSLNTYKLKLYDAGDANDYGFGTQAGTLDYHSGGSHIFYKSGSEKMRITSGGALLVNASSTGAGEKLRVNGSGSSGNAANFHFESTHDRANIIVRHDRASGSTSAKMIAFERDGGTEVGSVTSTGSATSFNTSSDYRLKENVVDLDGAITRVKQLQPKRFNFIVDADTTVDGFLAHEAATVVPEAVTGTHNEVDSDNNPVYQGIDQSKLVPLLTAALQEAIAEIETLKTKVAALEAG